MESTKKDPVNQSECSLASGSSEDSEFNFPFTPYEIQLQMMRAAYEAFEREKFALLESPTGTGKSLSLICSALTWLRDHQSDIRRKLQARKDAIIDVIQRLKEEEEVSGDWLTVQTRRKEASRDLEEVTKKLENIDKFDERSKVRRHAKLHNIPLENYATFMANETALNNTLDTTLNETREENNLITNSGATNQSTLADLTSMDEGDQGSDLEKSVKAKQDVEHLKPKIFYTSRTHSQLSQFVNEVKRTKFANIDLGPPIKVTSLASRANLCINTEVLKLKDPSAINERCMELQKESKSNARCPHIKAKELDLLKDDILTTVHDIEDLVSRGRAHGSCPYYAARLAIPEAELVVLPYNNLLHRETRQASSLDLKENIVIVDEAHNILETICSIHSVCVNGLQLIGSHTILSRYYEKYHNRMTPRNGAMIKTIVQCLTALIKYLSDPKQHLTDYDFPKPVALDQDENKKSQNSEEEILIDIRKFIGAAKIERFNVFKIIDYFQRSQLGRKLLGFFRSDGTLAFDIELHGLASKTEAQKKEAGSPKRKRQKTQETRKSAPTPLIPESESWEYTSLQFLKPMISLKTQQSKRKKQPEPSIVSYPIYILIEFLRSLTNFADDGKILTDYRENDIFNSSLKFVLLNPSSQFKQMVSEARSIVLAGGTMQPFEEFTNLLFGPLGVDESRLKLFSCGHVIDKANLHVSALTNGPSGRLLELSYKVKNCSDNIDEIGRAILGIASVAPGGMVCFLPSYEYEQICFTRWSQMGLISKIESRCKQVFREPRQTSHLKPILDEFSRTVEKSRSANRGALLFCVVGGKMSEGINFNDDLGRCVVMIGLPYANIKSAELQQKMAYYDRTCKQTSKGAPSPGQQYYENLCIKGVNQSIGRAIRHKDDYAAIILLDHRYSTKKNIKMGLPGWIRQSLSEYNQFGAMFNQLKLFYDNIKKR